VKFIASIIWNLSESSGIGLGRFAPYVFGVMVGSKPERGSVDMKPVNMIWAEESGIKVVIREAADRSDRRVIEIVRDGHPDEVLASATIAKHNRDRVADAFQVASEQKG
jgi:hypothetical protein